MTWNAYFSLATLALMVGLALSIHAVLATGVETLGCLWTRRASRVVERLLKAYGPLRGSKKLQFSTFNLKPLWPLLTIPLGLILVRDAMLALLVIVAGIGLAWWLGVRAGQKRREQIDEHGELLALRLRSLFPVEHSVLRSLKKAGSELPSGELAQTLAQVRTRWEMKQPPQEACQPLLNLPGTVTRRLAVLLAESAATRETVQMDLLALLEREIHHRRLLRTKIRQSLTLVRGTIRVLQGAVIAGLAATVTLPLWREYFLADASHRVLLVTLVTVSALASLFFEYEVMQMNRGESL